jgi:hypothetical protein
MSVSVEKEYETGDQAQKLKRYTRELVDEFEEES